MTWSRAGKPSLRRLAPLCVLALFLASCRPAGSAYFKQTSSAAQSGSALAGTKVYAGIANLEIQPGDRVTFESLEISIPGVRGLVGPLRATNGAIGLARERDLTASDLAPYRELGGPPYSSEDGPIGILLEITIPTNQVDIAAPVLTFIVNGRAPEQERLLMAVRICSAPNANDPCPAPDPPPIEGQ
jgi:hypothetical protein